MRKADKESQQVAVRLDTKTIERIDQYAETCGIPGVTLTRSDAIKTLITQSLNNTLLIPPITISADDIDRLKIKAKRKR
jgi:hypothetical protein